MQTLKSDDYWPPRPGSWEEAVQPYDAQFNQRIAVAERLDADELPVEARIERKADYRTTTTF